MGWWQTICTCVGCAAGAVCIIATMGTGTAAVVPLLIASGAGGVAGNVVGHKMDQDEQKTKNQAKDLALKDETIKTLKQDNEKAREEIANQNKKLEEVNEKIKKRDQEIKKIQNKLKDPNLSEEDRKKLKNELALLLTQQEDDNKEKDKITNTIQQLTERIKDNNKNIGSIGSGSSDKDKGIMNFFTLENILIVLAIYALWQIVIKEDRR